MSEWQRSKFQAFAVRQRRNFGHRNRTLLPPRAKVTRPGARNTLQKRADVGIAPEKVRWNSVGADDSVGPIDGGTVIVRADRVVRPYKLFDEPDAASPRRTFFPPDGKKRDALRPAPHMGNIY